MSKLRIVMVIVLGAFLGQIAGCASGPPSGQAAKWISENQAQRDRLEAEGFQQYVDGN